MINKQRSRKRIAALCGLLATLSLTPALAGTETPTPPAPAPEEAKESWDFTRLWDYPTLYDNKKNPYIQKFKIIGRYHGQYHWTDSNRGNNDDWENRRIRLGAQVDFLKDFKLKAQWNIRDPQKNYGPFFKAADVIYLDWKANKDLSFRLGRQKMRVSGERTTSSRNILTFNRALLVNQATADKVLGFTGTYQINKKLWTQAGIFSDVWDDQLEFKNETSMAGLLRLGYDLNKHTSFGLDYSYVNRKEGSTDFRLYRHIAALSSTSEWDNYGLNTDLLYANGSGLRSGQNVFGLTVTPWYDFTDKLQGVFRYHLATSDSDTGIFLQKRYEAFAVTDGGGRQGDLYNSFYGGLNFRINKDKLKLMTGVEYSNMSGRDGYSGWTYWVGARTYW